MGISADIAQDFSKIKIRGAASLRCWIRESGRKLRSAFAARERKDSDKQGFHTCQTCPIEAFQAHIHGDAYESIGNCKCQIRIWNDIWKQKLV